ncbi:MAG: ATP-binding protein [Spirosomataceae bacterium]
MNTRNKMALLLFSFCLFIIILLGGSVYFFLNHYSLIDFYKRLETRAQIAAQYHLERGTMKAENLIELRNQYLEKLPEENEVILDITQQQNSLDVIRSTDLPDRLIRQVYRQGKSNLRESNTFYVGLIKSFGTKRFMVVVSAENDYIGKQLAYVRNILLVAILVGIVLTWYIAKYFSQYIFEPVKRITEKVRQISTHNMNLRLTEQTENREIQDLILTFNNLLTRLETAFETQKNFISNASHELGTPLTTIIGEADLALRKERSTSQYQEAIQNILIQADRLNEITKTLLFLAQTGYSDKKIPLGMLRVDELLWDLKGLMNVIRPQNQVEIDVSKAPEDPKKLKINGNKELLRLALSNLITNAIKYSYNKPVQVSIDIQDEAQMVVVLIQDHGIGIPEKDLPFIFDPFFRGENTKLFEGFGVGLSLARNIILLHEGQMDIVSKEGEGTGIRISFPRYKF